MRGNRRDKDRRKEESSTQIKEAERRQDAEEGEVETTGRSRNTIENIKRGKIQNTIKISLGNCLWDRNLLLSNPSSRSGQDKA